MSSNVSSGNDSNVVYVQQKNEKQVGALGEKVVKNITSWNTEDGRHSGITVEFSDDVKISLPEKSLMGLRHWTMEVKGDTQVFTEHPENAKNVWCMTRTIDGKNVKVPHDEILGTLDTMPEGETVKVCMKNGFTKYMKTYEVNKGAGGKFRAFMYAVAPFIPGMTVGRTIVGNDIVKCVMINGEPATSKDIAEAFKNATASPVVACRMTLDSKGHVGIQDIHRLTE